MIETETLSNMSRNHHEAYLNERMSFDDWLADLQIGDIDGIYADAEREESEHMHGRLDNEINRLNAERAKWRYLELRYADYIEGVA